MAKVKFLPLSTDKFPCFAVREPGGGVVVDGESDAHLESTDARYRDAVTAQL